MNDASGEHHFATANIWSDDDRKNAPRSSENEEKETDEERVSDTRDREEIGPVAAR